MSILREQHRREQRMGAADARVEQGDIAPMRLAIVGRSLEEVVNPGDLFLNIHGIEEIGGGRWRRKRANGAKPPHGQGDVIARRLSNDDDVFGEIETIGPDLNLIGSGLCDEGVGFFGFQPDFPMYRAIVRREFVLWAAPERSQRGFGDGGQTLDELGVFGTAGNDLAVLFRIGHVLRFELLDLLAEAFDALGGGKDGRCFDRARFACLGIATQQRDSAGSQTILCQRLVRPPFDFEINARQAFGRYRRKKI
ncbi:hypothetical protein [Sphingobium sp. Leaf26]|uniref:hypothetical protein n=1 Tax=Sphingobium sp. Leaf26 TaxID=1735693 RepID=UPI001F2620A9|nr:hypothetical protein [Sphingobium sp. Leaf26]